MLVLHELFTLHNLPDKILLFLQAGSQQVNKQLKAVKAKPHVIDADW